MASDYGMLRRGVTSFPDYMKLEDEFRMKKEQAARQAQMDALTMQKAQKEIESGVATNDPAAVREWQFYSQLPKEERTKYLQMKRADQIMNLGGTMAVRSPTGGVQEAYEVTPRIVDMPDFQAMQEGAKTSARLGQELQVGPQIEREKVMERIRAEDLANSQVNYDKTQEQGRQVLDVITDLENDPGLSAVIGVPNPFKGGFGLFNVPATPAANFKAKLEQLEGKQFLEAFESLKGGGQITQIEGEKATKAIARMQTTQSEQEFKNALKDFKEIVLRAQARADAKIQTPQVNPLEASRAAIRNFDRQNPGAVNPNRTMPPESDPLGIRQ